jgi:hypothetical protein
MHRYDDHYHYGTIHYYDDVAGHHHYDGTNYHHHCTDDHDNGGNDIYVIAHYDTADGRLYATAGHTGHHLNPADRRTALIALAGAIRAELGSTEWYSIDDDASADEPPRDGPD